MNKVFVYISLIFCIVAADSKAWDTTAAKYYPLKIGNTYSYQKEYYSLFCALIENTTYQRVKITGDTLMPNGKNYFIFTGFDYFSLWNYQRLDSNSMNVYGYYNGNEIMLDSLLGRTGDNFSGKRNFNSVFAIVDDKINNFFLFGSFWNAKVILNNSNELFFEYYLLENIGLGHMVVCTKDSGYILSTLGCVISGDVYGDTAFTGIQQINSSIPDKFYLSQNFPNPFNPNTIINYQLPNTNYVSLKVYDVLGNEIATLVNENQNRGSYNYQLSTANYQLSSGIYFYKLEAGSFTETKRMILLK